MRCFEVTINDKIIGVIGHADAPAMFASLEASRDVDPVRLECTALLPDRDGKAVYGTWGSHELALGDTLRIRIVESEQADRPTIVVHGVGEEGGTTDAQWPFCSFCGKSAAEVQSMVGGRRAYICDGCIDEITTRSRAR